MIAGNRLTEVQKEEYKQFFETHGAVYENNFYRQGLFLLGAVINSVVAAQFKKTAKKSESGTEEGKKEKRSSTFMKKLNYSGIPARRVINLVNEVQNYVQIYDVYEEPGIWGNLTDRLQGIENSGMKGEEVLFYILTGYSYAKYLGMIHAK